MQTIIKKINNNKVIKAGMWYTFGNFFVKGISFITIPIFTRLLSTSDYGIINVYNTWLGIFTIVLSLNLYSGAGRAKYEFKDSYNQFLSSVLFLSTIIFLFFSFLIILLKNFFLKFLSLQSSLVYVLLIQSYFTFVQQYYLSKLRFNYYYKSYILISIISSISVIILSIFLITAFKNEKYLGRIYGGFIVIFILGIILYLKLIIHGKKLIDFNYWKYALVFSVPLIPHSLSGIILAQFDRIMINKFIGSSEAGIYSFAYNLGLIVNVIWVSFNNAWSPWFYENMEKIDFENINRKLKYYIVFFSSLIFIAIFISPEIVKIMSSKNYWSGLKLVPIIMSSYFFVFLYSLFVNIEFYYKKTHFISLGTILSAILNIILNYLLIPKYGYIAAAWTTFVSYVFYFLYNYIIVKFILKKQIYKIKYILYSILFIISAILIFNLFQNSWIIRYSIVFLTAFILIKTIKKGRLI
ncbi:Membrane protein involved in the export of O-antigen and teichoic acid [Marinitoga hydrogenitolerans DSM 16785]|uniref:Membrane protein involved in the export of O-antigen and teichoic acid n=1 Tax=Marinitoga hydrogenitolerans (strain DSM 16785 / JCM 12826 / AT1271) TaxID=1122195 RepID=A0A1M4Y3K2_MARH1|nr:oligosaccharide flippase family protein [Marinitoga hydrogenitolerans]SHF00397.1 Membrane protein involved in the export of O-antigen and teichoic acid [Marinitoga hydrogenitolerans DSM 16785]